MTELKDFSELDLLAELERRKTDEDSTSSLVFGTIGIDGGRSFVEVFKEIKTPEDMSGMSTIRMRARMNSQRYYRGFYFKTDDFKALETSLDEDNEAFADWVNETESVKFIKL